MQTEFELLHRFTIRSESIGSKRSLQFLDNLSPRTARVINTDSLSLASRTAKLAALRMLVPPCVVHSPLLVRELPNTVQDAHFWQFPAITERKAYERHKELPLPEWQPETAEPVHTYLGLPWASYVDKHMPDDIKMVFGTRLRGYQALVAAFELEWGKGMAVHTVCQHIYWKRLLPFCAEIGITDLHLSHCEPGSQNVAQEYGIRVHSWPLVAPNLVNAERQVGLTIGKPWQERRLLASFIGSHMPHYRSDVRLRLRDEVVHDGGSDVVFHLGDDWHFNLLVYGAQVAGKRITNSDAASEQQATKHYNEVLSDSVFALCPEGAGPNTLRLWEALGVGSIPVVIVEDWIWPQVPGTGLGWDDAVIRVQRDEISGVFDRLRDLRTENPEKLSRMQSAGLALYERFGKMLCF